MTEEDKAREEIIKALVHGYGYEFEEVQDLPLEKLKILERNAAMDFWWGVPE